MSTLANPIGPVLDAFGVQMATGTPPPPPAGSIAGKVIESVGGANIVGATVSLDTGQSTTTDDSGDYTLSGVPEGTRTVTASAPGFVSASKDVIISETTPDATANFALEVAVEPTIVQIACVTLANFRFAQPRARVAHDESIGIPSSSAKANACSACSRINRACLVNTKKNDSANSAKPRIFRCFSVRAWGIRFRECSSAVSGNPRARRT